MLTQQLQEPITELAQEDEIPYLLEYKTKILSRFII
jgi:hypothetical protein